MRIRLLVSMLAVSGLIPGMAQADPQDEVISRSVVRILATQRRPDLHKPWTAENQQEVAGSGVVIEGKRILTSAQIVKYASSVLVEVAHSGEKHAATVEFLADDVDLAVLKLDDPVFFDGRPPLTRRADLPKVKDVVLTYGFPVGGDNISITRGIVSRIDFEEYYYLTMGLRIQVDAAINSGNSGGPAMIGDQMIGIIFFRLEEADNIGYIIPNEEIDLFLKDIADGAYDGKPQMTDILQSLENKTLRAALKVPKDTDGMVIRRVDRPERGSPLRPLDVITKIGDLELDPAGKVKLGDDNRVDFRYYIQKLTRDGRVPLTVLRDGAPMEIQAMVSPGPARNKVLPNLMGRNPSYFVWGPLAFAAASDDLLDTYDAQDMASAWYPFLSYNLNPMLGRRGDWPRFEGEQIVVALALFPHKVSRGYASPASNVVDTVDGYKVRNLRHLAELLRDAKGERITIAFADKNSEILIFDRKEVLDASEEILNENGIRHPFSDDLKGVFPER